MQENELFYTVGVLFRENGGDELKKYVSGY